MAKTSMVPNPAKIKVIGLGGGGCNAITRMVREEIRGAEFIAMNTDAQALAIAEAPVRVQLGARLTRGLGAGGDHVVGQKAAEESRDEIKELIAGADMVFVTAGMGGGTGTGSAPVIADLARQSGALTIGVVTKPFGFEGNHRRRTAEEGIANLLGKVDTLVIIPNDRVLTICDQRTSVDSAFRIADDVLLHGIQAITEVITVPGLINLDFADVRAIMKDAGPAWMSVGTGVGQSRAVEAAMQALASPLLDCSIQGARGVLFNVVGGENLTLFEVNEAANIIKQSVDPEANIIFGVAYDDSMQKEIRITLIATGFIVSRGPAGFVQSEGLTQMLNELRKSEEDMDMPSFLRNRDFNSRRKMPPPTKKESAGGDKVSSEAEAQ